MKTKSRIWTKTKLGDVLTLQRGYDLPERDRREGNVPIVTSSGITGYHDTAKVDGPGVVTGRYGTLGEVYFVKEDFWPHNTTLFVKDFKGNDPLFVKYFLGTLGLGVQSAAAAVPGLNRNALHLLPVRIPSLSTQRKIAAILSAYDDLIENNTRRIKILEEMAQMLYREWFVNFRFPGHAKVRMVNSRLGQVPEGWEIVELGEIAEVNKSSVKKGEEPIEINYVDIASVTTGQIETIQLMPFVDAPGRARRIVKDGDIIWSMVRPNRKSFSLILKPLPNLIVSTGFAVIGAKQVPYTYLYQSMTTDDFVGYLTNHATGAAYPAVSASDFEKADILIPPKRTLDLFHSIAKDFFVEKEILGQKNINLRRTRDLLLPKLISGAVEVEGLDIRVS